MPHHASLSIKVGLIRDRFAAGARIPSWHPARKIESRQPVSSLVEDEIAEPLAAIA
jgi:hypothetical protein